MKHLIIGAAALAMSATLAAADPAAGTWKTEAGETGGYLHVNIAPCGADICGTIAKVVNNDNQSIVGKNIIWNMKSNGGGSYSGGKIWAPDTDKTYNSKMSLSGNSLKVQGCVLGICRGQTWSRVN